MFCIVPNHVRDAIDRQLDEAFLKVPEAAVDREALFNGLLRIFDDTGEIPDFELTRREP